MFPGASDDNNPEAESGNLNLSQFSLDFNDAHPNDPADEPATDSMHPSPASPHLPGLPSLQPSLDLLVSPSSLVPLPTSSQPSAPATSPAPAGQATLTVESAEQFDDAAIDEDAHSLRTASSSALSVSVALDMTRAPIPTSTEELWSEVRRLRMKMGLLEKEIARAKVKKDAFDARCAVMRREVSEVKELDSQKAKTTRRALKSRARHVAASTAKAQSAAKRRQKARLAKAKVDNAAREAWIREDIEMGVFTSEVPQ